MDDVFVLKSDCPSQLQYDPKGKNMLIKSMRIKGMLSFQDMSLDLRPLNVLIGPNASGKSNLIEMVALLQSAPRDLAGFIRQNGGISEWLWKGNTRESGSMRHGYIEVLLDYSNAQMPLRYALELAERGQGMDIVQEFLENERPLYGEYEPYHFFQLHEGNGMIRVSHDYEERFRTRRINPHDLTPGQSILHEIRDPTIHQEMNWVRRQFDAAHLYREWNMGRNSGIRKPQQTDLASDYLREDFSNLALVLNQMQSNASIREVEQNLQQFYDMYEQVSVGIQANTAQLWIRERGLATVVPATRLSDGTLRFLALLTILCHPTPPPLICIEEPELGLHPDIIPIIAKLLVSASERTQLIVTTHSKALIDQLWEDPESIVVCERDFDSGSEFKRLSSARLEKWLERYELGELWEKGEIGGNRW